jgi:hypothetical protein
VAVHLVGHVELASTAEGVPDLADWRRDLRRRYVGG